MHQIGMLFVISDNPFVRRGFSENYEYHSFVKNIFSSRLCKIVFVLLLLMTPLQELMQ